MQQHRHVCTLVWLFLLSSTAVLAGDASSTRPLRLAIVNQVHFHLEVVAGAMHILKDYTTEPVDVYLPAKVVKTNWYGFFSWMGNNKSIRFKECKEYDGVTTYDLVWFISPEYHLPYIETTSKQMKPKVALYMVHNGHIKDADFKRIQALSPQLPLLSLAPHVAHYISNRTSQPTDWILPIYPFMPAKKCGLDDMQVCVTAVRCIICGASNAMWHVAVV